MAEDDYKLAWRLQRELDQENISPRQEALRTVVEAGPSSLVSPEWELIDPNPDVYALFQTFSDKFFWGQLGAVEVKWSQRMYSSAGVCTYRGRAGCVVSLSLPLLKLRPRKDLVETLLHEMIHAYLFVTHNDKDRHGHGPEFKKHMQRINQSAGTNITIYHNFIDEVKVYQTHWWQCDGPCRSRPPYFGLVKKPMNRPPSRHDQWYSSHQATCGGKFVKIKEPENYRTKKKTNKLKGMKDLTSYFNNNTSSDNSNVEDPSKTASSTVETVPKTNIHGFSNKSLAQPVGRGHNGGGTLKSNRGGTFLLNPTKTASSNSPEPLKLPQQHTFQSFSGKGHVLGNSSTNDRHSFLSSSVPSTPVVDLTKTGRSDDSQLHASSTSTAVTTSLSNCPVCNDRVSVDRMNDHLDGCLQVADLTAEDFADDIELPPDDGACALPVKYHCPCCNLAFPSNGLESHLEECLHKSFS